jgi:hypothetical protein
MFKSYFYSRWVLYTLFVASRLVALAVFYFPQFSRCKRYFFLKCYVISTRIWGKVKIFF